MCGLVRITAKSGNLSLSLSLSPSLILVIETTFCSCYIVKKMTHTHQCVWWSASDTRHACGGQGANVGVGCPSDCPNREVLQLQQVKEKERERERRH